MDHEKEQKQARADLGLSQILNQGPSIDIQGRVSELLALRTGSENGLSNGSYGTGSSDTAADDELTAYNNESIDPYRGLWEQEKFEELIQYCEERMTGEERVASEARLWWVQAHHQKKVLPLPVLAVPLASLLQDGQRNSDHFTGEQLQDLHHIAATIAEEMHDRGDAYLALELLYAARQSGADCQSQVSEVASELHASLSQKRKRNSSEQTQFEFIQSVLHSDPPVRLSPDPVPARAPGLTMAAESDGVFDQSDASKAGEPVVTQPGSWKSYRVSVLCLLLAVASACLYLYSPQADARFSMNYARIQHPTAEPIPPRLEFETGLRHLDAILYEVEEGRKASPKPPVQTAGVKRVSTQNARASSSATAAPPKGKKFEVNTTGPPEPDHVQKLRSSWTRTTRETQDRVELKPVQMAGTRRVAAKTGLEYYLIITDTPIMAKARYQAIRLGFLRAGEKVRVAQQTGEWLELRSRNGRNGYILAQDAEKVIQ